MFDKERVIIMARLAVYDKHHAKDDIKKERYFRHDWIYKRNARGRAAVFFGCAALVILYEARKMLSGELNLLTMDYKAEAARAVIFAAAAMIVYTVIGTFLYTAEYQAARKRLDWYFAALGQLDERVQWLKRRQQGERDEYRTITRRGGEDGGGALYGGLPDEDF